METEFIQEIAQQVAQTIQKKASNAMDGLFENIEAVEILEFDQKSGEASVTKQKYGTQQPFEGLDKLDLLESRAVQNQKLSRDNQVSQSRAKKRRIKEIQQQKKKIADQLQKLDGEVDVIKGKSGQDNYFKKRNKIQRDQSATKQAQQLVKDLKLQRIQLEVKRKKEQQKMLKGLQKQDEQRKKHREQETLRIKQQRKQAILQRMEEEKRKKEERRQIEEQSNHLIVKLKKQEKLEKQASMVPSQIVDVENKKRALQKKNNFDFKEIQDHDRKYRQMKSKMKKEKEERSESLKVPKSSYLHKYGKNIWIQKIEEQEQHKKQEDKLNQQRRKNQLDKRLKYGELVKNIFMPKKREKSIQRDHTQSQHTQLEQQQRGKQKENLHKPLTPQNISSLPKIKSISKRNTQNSKMYREQSLPGIKNSKKLTQNRKQIKQFEVEDQENEKIKKIREQQLRKQTNDRLKKIQNQGNNKQPAEPKRKYQNYLGKVKARKPNENEWKKIIDNTKMTEEEKYRELMKKAEDLENQAKKKQDKNHNRQADEDAVNLYIGSIQAKLALLEKF